MAEGRAVQKRGIVIGIAPTTPPTVWAASQPLASYETAAHLAEELQDQPTAAGVTFTAVVFHDDYPTHSDEADPGPLLDQLDLVGIDVDPRNCDTAALRQTAWELLALAAALDRD